MRPTDVAKIGLSAIKSLEKLHTQGVVHNDIKPDNILLSINHENYEKAFLIDFGCSRTYLGPNGEHQSLQTDTNTITNNWWASPNIIQKNVGTRRDDIIQLIYTLIFCLDNFIELLEKVFNEDGMGAFKLRASADEFCGEGPARILAPLLNEAYKYTYNE